MVIELFLHSLRMVGAEMPSNSDLIKWAEQGRLHIKYTDVTTNASAAELSEGTFTVADTLIPANQVMNSGTASNIGIRIWSNSYDIWKCWFFWNF